MMRIPSALFASIVLIASAGAAEIKGEFVKFDEKAKVLTVKVEGKDTDFTLTDDTKVMTVKGQPAKKGIQAFADPKKAKAGAPLTVITEKKDAKDAVTEVRLGGKKK